MLRYGLAAVLAVLSAASAAQSFEAACDGLSAPAADVRVLFAPAAAQVDESKASREIELDTKKAGAFRHLGVTRATLLRDVDVRLDGYTDPQTGRACAWPKVKLRLRVQPLLIELARELGADPCMRAHVFEHEMQHVAIYNAAVLRAQVQLESEMRAHFNERQLVGDATTLMGELQAQIADRWLTRLDALLAVAESEHDALDAAEERQAYSVCNGALSKLIKSME
jgi:hypothetical protein